MPSRRNHHYQLLAHPWQGGHPLQRRVGRWRQWLMLLLLIFLLGIIFGYGYVTNPVRVRAMAQAYLSKVVGGPVEMGNATLSIFQGLRLDDVKVKVDHSNRPDSVLLTAQTFLVRYDLKSMLKGDLEARQIIIINPRLYLSEDLDTGQRNYQRLVHRTEAASRPFNEQGHPVALPEILLRNAEVEYTEVSHGQFHPLGLMRVDGQISPTAASDQYHFEFQSRSETEGIGPIVTGSISTASGAVEARLTNFQFNEALMNMLPSVVRRWGQDHQLSGRVDVPIVEYTSAAHGKPPRFRVQVALKGVRMTVHPQEWMGRNEITRRRRLKRSQTAMRDMGLNFGRAADLQEELLSVSAVTLDNVTGNFVFSPEGIDIERLRGQMDSNTIQIEGHIDGYSPDAPLTIRIRSLKDENLFIPQEPQYIKALPGDLRELYEHLHPQGSCRLWAEGHRGEPGAAVRVRGEVDVLDGQFLFDLFPYPLRRARGKITFGPDSKSGIDRCDIIDLRALGAPGGPNENTSVVINASIVPLGGDAEVKVHVKSDRVYSEPLLIQAMPPEVKETLQMFARKGENETYPTFNGSFLCEVHRPPGPHRKWMTTVDLQMADSHGAFSLFPYPLDHLRGHLHIGDHFVDIDKMTMINGKTSLVVDGRVSFEKDRPLNPELTITARHVPLDKAFIDSIPQDRRPWVRNAGLGGMMDIDGHVFRPDDRAPITYQLDVSLNNGSVWPANSTYAVGSVDAKLRITPASLSLLDFHGRRGNAELSGTGELTGMDHHPRLKLFAQANNLSMEPALYQLLPSGAKEAWDEVRPTGTLNATLQCDLAVGEEMDEQTRRDKKTNMSSQTASTAPSTAPLNRKNETNSSSFNLTLRPVSLSMTPKVVPYRLDDLTGAIHITNKGVALENMTARHGAARIDLSGTGTTGGKTGDWDLKLALANAPIDAELKTALPSALRDLVEAMKLKGSLSVQFDKLHYVSSEQPDVDFAGRLWLQDASLDAGVELEHAKGTIDLNGNIRQGRLGDLQGMMKFPSLMMAERPVTNLRGELIKSLGSDSMRIDHLQAGVAGGEMGGQVDLSFPQQGPSKYTLGIILRNADIQELSGESGHDMRGQLSASLSLEGDWSDPTSRRGRGDVAASGKKMYRIPLLLGLMQITNLSLPINQPFNEASARYSVEGNHVTFEQIELRSDTMAMQGSGQLDFGTKKVQLTFVMDNPNAIKLPFLTDLFNGFKQELFQIHINGSITQAANAAGTYQTTVDNVYPGGAGGK